MGNWRRHHVASGETVLTLTSRLSSRLLHIGRSLFLSVAPASASPREESRLSGSFSLPSTDQRPSRVPKHEWNASSGGRCTRETTALERNGPGDSPGQGRTVLCLEPFVGRPPIASSYGVPRAPAQRARFARTFFPRSNLRSQARAWSRRQSGGNFSFELINHTERRRLPCPYRRISSS